jgi:transcriptional regulator with XRE-family HTH domain
MNERERIGKRIAELRAQMGISQARLAELSGVGYSHIARIEKGYYSVGVDVLAKLADALNVELDFNPKK